MCFFFFQAEDGIRYRTVTGVQTCALPICANRRTTWRQHERRITCDRSRVRNERRPGQRRTSISSRWADVLLLFEWVQGTLRQGSCQVPRWGQDGALRWSALRRWDRVTTEECEPPRTLLPG